MKNLTRELYLEQQDRETLDAIPSPPRSKSLGWQRGKAINDMAQRANDIVYWPAEKAERSLAARLELPQACHKPTTWQEGLSCHLPLSPPQASRAS